MTPYASPLLIPFPPRALLLPKRVPTVGLARPRSAGGLGRFLSEPRAWSGLSGARGRQPGVRRKEPGCLGPLTFSVSS